MLTREIQAIAAAAISTHAGLGETVAAGAWVSAAVLLLSATGLLRWLTRHIPVPVVKGIQLGAGLSLIMSAGTSLLHPLGWTNPPLDNRLWALAVFVLLLCTQRLVRFPYAFAMFLLGLTIAFIVILTGWDGHSQHRVYRLPHLAFWHPRVHIPAWFRSHAFDMAVGQLPLTTLNSIIAVSALAADLLPDLPTPSVTAMGFSVAAMNLVGCWFGAMPVCHGSGGLAAQYRFGARSGASIILLGLFKMLLGLFFGRTLVDLLGTFPRAVLGIMVVAAGLELAKVGVSLNHGAPDLWETSVEGDGDGQGVGAAGRRRRDVSEEERSERWTVMMVTTAGLLAFRNDAVGFLAGMLCFWTYRLADYWEKRKERRVLVRNERTPLLR